MHHEEHEVFIIIFPLFVSFMVNIFLTNNTGPLINGTYAQKSS